MAKAKKAEKSAIQIAADGARAKFTAAQEAVAKGKTPANEKALTDAKAVMETAVQAENRERFERVGGGRVGKVISGLENIGKLAKPRSYAFTESDIAKIETAATAALVAAIAALRNANKPKGAAAVAGFKF